jgi:hypothetical protein
VLTVWNADPVPDAVRAADATDPATSVTSAGT